MILLFYCSHVFNYAIGNHPKKWIFVSIEITGKNYEDIMWKPIIIVIKSQFFRLIKFSKNLENIG